LKESITPNMSLPSSDPDLNRKEQTDEAVLSPWQDLVRRLLRHRLAMIGGVIILCFIVIAIIAPWITSYPYDQPSLVKEDTLQPPSAKHWFGTDDLGRDIFTRIVYGTRISLWIGLFSVLGSIVVGTFLGTLAGYYGRWVDMVISRVFDIIFAFPGILLAIAIVAVLKPSLFNALVAISIINVPTFGRLIRSRVLSLKSEEYIVAAQAIGMKNSRIIFRHILPNTIAPIIVQGSLGIATAILEAAALGFLGLGAQRPTPEWGLILADSRGYFSTAPWMVLFPGLAIMLTVLGFNLLGDGLRDVLDPKMRD
jgi:peptide/nickel transport system permease protein